MSTENQVAPAESGVLTAAEKETLLTLERKVDAGLSTFIDVGEALMKIKAGNLYRESHKTFKEYCQERWGFSDSRARQFIGAAGVAKPVTNVTLSSEAVARAVNAVPEAIRGDVLKVAADIWGNNLTAKNVAAARELYRLPADQRIAAWEEFGDYPIGDLREEVMCQLRSNIEKELHQAPCPFCGGSYPKGGWWCKSCYKVPRWHFAWNDQEERWDVGRPLKVTSITS